MRSKITSLAIAGIFIGAAPVVAEQSITSIIAVGVVESSIESAARRRAATPATTYTTAPAATYNTAPTSFDAPKIYAVRSSANYCPNGLQPITIDGVICCGTPNQSVSYQSMKAHPVVRKVRARRVNRAPTSRIVCPVGEKGCYTE